MSRRGSGHRAERRALWHYRLRGYRILGTNVWVAGCELDLIVRRGRRLLFVEVKSKSQSGFGYPEATVDTQKQRRLAAAAEMWLARRPECWNLDMSLEVFAVAGREVRRLALGDRS